VAAASAHASNITREPMLFVVPSAPRAAAQPRPSRAEADARESTGPMTAEPAGARADEAGGAEDAGVPLTLDHDIGEGPAVGAKTVKRLRALGIDTVRDLLKADPAALALRLNQRSVTGETVGAWQDQALIMCAIPGLRGRHAQLLVGAGYRSAEAVAQAEADKLCADVLSFAATAAGQRVLRNGEVPDIRKINSWLEAARRMRAA
jgi:hypothetical protein